jgi:hypothetical protein
MLSLFPDLCYVQLNVIFISTHVLCSVECYFISRLVLCAVESYLYFHTCVMFSCMLSLFPGMCYFQLNVIFISTRVMFS